MLITRDEAIAKIKVNDEKLPYCLRENNIDADRLLFKEA